MKIVGIYIPSRRVIVLHKSNNSIIGNRIMHQYKFNRIFEAIKRFKDSFQNQTNINNNFVIVVLLSFVYITIQLLL